MITIFVVVCLFLLLLQFNEGVGPLEPRALPGCDWGYVGITGPEHWGTVCNASFSVCGNGQQQSPINFHLEVISPNKMLSQLAFDYQYQRYDNCIIINKGHTVEVDPPPNGQFGKITQGPFGIQGYQLIQFHVHTKAEHLLDGQRLDMEIHFVHSNPQGRLAVVGFMFQIGQVDHPFITLISTHIQGLTHEGDTSYGPIDYNLLFKDYAGADYWYYNGSLTTPPCTEGVQWLVYQKIGYISLIQYTNFTAAQGNNARALQLPFGRVVSEYMLSSSTNSHAAKHCHPLPYKRMFP